MADETGTQEAMNNLLTDFASSPHIAKAVDDVADDYRKAGQYEKSRQWHQYVVDHWPQDERASQAQRGVAISNIVLGYLALSPEDRQEQEELYLTVPVQPGATEL
jgi:hypothetical protein